MSTMYYALAANSDVRYAAFSGEAWAEAGKVTLLGMLMIFGVLSLLWGVLAIFKVLFVKGDKKEKQEKKVSPEPKKAEPVAKVEAPVSVAPSAATNDDAMIAVITAAITAYRASEEGMDSASASGFRVVSFKRAGRCRAWNSNK